MDTAEPPKTFTDIGVWRLFIYISEQGMSAYIKNIQQPSLPPQLLFETEWKPAEESLLRKIESTVYDNPRLLDDYATEVIIQSGKCLQIPADLIAENQEAEEDFFCTVFKVEPDDIFFDDNGTEFCLYTLTPGLPAFIRRTLPGAKVRSHLSNLICHLRNRTSDMSRIYCDIRNGQMDIVAFSGKELLSASTQYWETPEDISYRILLLMQTYELTRDKVEIKLSGLKAVKTEVSSELRKFVNFVSFFPSSTSSEVKLPLGGLLEIYRNTEKP